MGHVVTAGWVLVVGVLLSGCTWKARIVTEPSGATVTLADGRRVLAPETVRFRYRPFTRQRLLISAPGYRTIETHISRQALARPFKGGGGPRSEVRFILVKEHGPAGTWTIEEQLE